MKQLFLKLLLIMTVCLSSSYAYVFRETGTVIFKCSNPESLKDNICNLLGISSTSLPTIFAADQTDLDSEELSILVFSEIGEEETPVINAISKKLSIGQDEVVEIVMELSENGRKVTLENIELMASQLQ